jgi:hypothetical protein
MLVFLESRGTGDGNQQMSFVERQNADTIFNEALTASHLTP